MTQLDTRHAAARLRALDNQQPGRNDLDLFISASGGYGKARQDQLLADVRTLYASVLGPRSLFTAAPPVDDPPHGFDAA